MPGLSQYPTSPPTPMTFLHAGPAVLGEASVLHSLEHYLRVCGDEALVLVHGGRDRLHAVAERLDVPEIELEAEEVRLGEDREAAELALQLGASSIEFAIDRPALSRPGGRPVQEMTVREAERFARTTALPERIRCKLLAAADGVRRGLRHARIGGPLALLRNRATVVYPDAEVQIGRAMPEPQLPLAQDDEPPLAAVEGAACRRASTAPGIERRPRQRVVSCSPLERAAVFTPAS